jgi:hypothetical protein
VVSYWSEYTKDGTLEKHVKSLSSIENISGIGIFRTVFYHKEA